ncbi:hypothetical protein [Phenylobacterium aquaticum]|nr:hypothetical protein [Phenylobacterium aquaticum]MCI3134033.1 hypothetical protein [Phenylobacterium aquaticum]
MSSPDCFHDTRPAKGWPERIAVWTILAFLVGLPAVLEIAISLRDGLG